MTAKNWFVYMIRAGNGQLYTGITTDIQRRWHEHTTGKGGARYFRTSKPQTISLLEEHPDRSSASRREAAIKKLAKSAKETLVIENQLLTTHLLTEEQVLMEEQVTCG